jgi:hypothetical protein
MNLSLSIDRSTTGNRKGDYSHAVCRSDELLSCARTSFKILLRSSAERAADTHLQDPSHLELYNRIKHDQHSPLNDVLSEGLEILTDVQSELRRLNEFVRRRGHSNDPTQEINASVVAIERDVAELTSIVQSMPSRGSVRQQHNQQRNRHIKVIQESFQSMIGHYVTQLKEVLSVRATVLSEQASRRGIFQPSSASNNRNPNTSALATISAGFVNADANAAQNALHAPLPQRSNLQKPHAAQHGRYSSTHAEESKSYQLNSSVRAGATPLPAFKSVNGEMYEGKHNSASTQINGAAFESMPTERGMRRRKMQHATAIGYNNASDSNSGANHEQQFLVYETQQQNRQTAARLKDARHAEQSLVALGAIFGKMSTLIVQQSETLDKIEDDVEAAHVDVDAGRNEITILYSIKKGNRMLIIKVYSLIIFLIVFMKFYARK